MSDAETDHGGIAAVRWMKRDSPETGESTREEMVDWIGDREGFAHVRDKNGHDVEVRVVNASPPYLRTYADGVWTDNLLALPWY